MPGAPYTNWGVLAFLAMVAVFLAFDEGTRVALYVAPVWFAILGVGYKLTQRREAFAIA
jgi:AAT family amino acid transporter